MCCLLKHLLESNPFNYDCYQEYKLYFSWLKPEIESPNKQNLNDHYYWWNNNKSHSNGLIKNVRLKDTINPKAAGIPWAVALDSLRSGHNVGSILRTSDCFGFQKVILGGYSPQSTHKSVKAAAMGAETWVNIEHTDNLYEYLKAQKSCHGQNIFGLELGRSAVSLPLVNLPGNGIIIVGNEETGISRRLKHLCSSLVKIPLYGRKASLNVSVAFGIFAHNLRQKSLERSTLGRQAPLAY